MKDCDEELSVTLILQRQYLITMEYLSSWKQFEALEKKEPLKKYTPTFEQSRYSVDLGYLLDLEGLLDDAEEVEKASKTIKTEPDLEISDHCGAGLDFSWIRSALDEETAIQSDDTLEEEHEHLMSYRDVIKLAPTFDQSLSLPVMYGEEVDQQFKTMEKETPVIIEDEEKVSYTLVKKCVPTYVPLYVPTLVPTQRYSNQIFKAAKLKEMKPKKKQIQAFSPYPEGRRPKKSKSWGTLGRELSQFPVKSQICPLCTFCATTTNPHRQLQDHMARQHLRAELLRDLPTVAPYTCPLATNHECTAKVYSDWQALMRHYMGTAHQVLNKYVMGKLPHDVLEILSES